jgi:hypothetical protein
MDLAHWVGVALAAPATVAVLLACRRERSARRTIERSENR